MRILECRFAIAEDFVCFRNIGKHGSVFRRNLESGFSLRYRLFSKFSLL